MVNNMVASKISKIHTNREELLVRIVLALPKDSNITPAIAICFSNKPVLLEIALK